MGMTKQPKALADAIPVLITRPFAEGQVFSDSLSARFGDRVHPLISPLMAVKYLTPDLPAGPFSAVIFTSAAGVAGALCLRADLPQRAFCVGAKTAERARAAGFNAVSADGDAMGLVAMVRAAMHGGRLLYLHGKDTRGEVAERLNSAGLETESRTVYQQVAQPLSTPALALLRAKGPVLVPLFSPRTAALFQMALPAEARATLHLVVISPAVAEVAARLPHAGLVLARHPDAGAMLDAVAQVLQGPLLP